MIMLDDFYLLVGGAFISGLVGLIFSWITLYLRERIEKGRIEKGFYLEITELKKIIKPIVEDFRASKWTVGSPTYLDSLVKKIQLNESQPLYTDNGWYCVFQKDIVLFDKNLMEETILYMVTNF